MPDMEKAHIYHIPVEVIVIATYLLLVVFLLFLVLCRQTVFAFFPLQSAGYRGLDGQA